MGGAEREREVVAGVPSGLLVGGTWRRARSGRTLAVEDPATGDVLTEVADAGPDDGLAALEAAAGTQAAWAATAPRRRGEVLTRAFEVMRERLDELALLMTLEMGKPVAESRAEVAYAGEFLRWFGEEAVRVEGDYRVAPDGGSRIVTMRQPVGPCLLITPWNFPLAMGARKIGPAIAAGCTMVVKPAAQTPLSMLSLAAILQEAGLPDGVLNVMATSEPGDLVGPLLADPRLRKLSFTGSTETGRRLMAQAAPNLLRLSLELGGNAPFIVFADADLDRAVDGAVVAKMRNTGEACTAANRFLVEATVATEFAERLAARLGSMKVGRGTDDGVEVGPLIDATQGEKVAGLVDGAVAAGARVLVGGSRLGPPGYFFAPTVLDRVPAGADILRREVFGPVAPVVTFDDEDEAVTVADDSRHGLVAYVYTRDLDRALRVCERLETGMVGLNQGMVSNPAAPFGGVKQSGFGREGGREGILEYLRTKYVAVRS
ncbi:MAG: NAD-dependent succinate-semialdehyde dehydrogenase [Actinomycetota bacterium]